MSDPDDPIAAVSAAPVGTIKLYRTTEEQPDLQQAMKNLGELRERTYHARQMGCLIEVVSLRLQYMDMWLRVYFENTPHSEARARDFARLLKQCFSQGLGKGLYDRILKFNKDRVNAIHGYLVGVMRYEDLANVVAESDGLSEELIEFILVNSGEVVTMEFFEGPEYKPGDQMLHVPNYIAGLRSQPPI